MPAIQSIFDDYRDLTVQTAANGRDIATRHFRIVRPAWREVLHSLHIPSQLANAGKYYVIIAFALQHHYANTE